MGHIVPRTDPARSQPLCLLARIGLPGHQPRPADRERLLNLPQFGVTLANAALFAGSNADLGPETATTWSVGADLDTGPFRASLTYYNINYSNRIQSPDVFTA